MVKKQNFLKNLLTSVSVASVLASIGGSSVAFGSGNDYNIDYDHAGAGATINLSAIWGNEKAGSEDRAVFNANNLSLIVDEDAMNVINGIIVKNTGAHTIINNDINIGTIIIDGGNTTTATINIGKTLLLDGYNHTGLGVTTLNG